MEISEDRRYTEQHEWARLEDDGTITVGITDFAQDQLGDVVYVELPDEGTNLASEEAFGVVESVKTVSDLFAPISGRVVAVNEDVVNSPEILNVDPHEGGWLVVIEPSDPREFNDLLSASEYRSVAGD